MEIRCEKPVQIGGKAPAFNMPSTRDMETLTENVSLNDYRGRWLVLFFYPLDFTYICPTEIRAFSDHIAEFRELDADVLGVSTDSVYSHRAWINGPRDRGGLGPLAFPLASDVTKEVSRRYGMLLEERGIALRGTFIIDPDQNVRYSVVHDLDVGRNVEEVLRVLQALQTGGLCPVGWQPREATLQT